MRQIFSQKRTQGKFRRPRQSRSETFKKDGRCRLSRKTEKGKSPFKSEPWSVFSKKDGMISNPQEKSRCRGFQNSNFYPKTLFPRAYTIH